MLEQKNVNRFVNFCLDFCIAMIDDGSSDFGATMYPTEPYVKAVLGQHEPLLCGMFERAWTSVSSFPGRSQLDFKRTIATLMHQFMMNEVRSQLSAEFDVRFMENHETIRLLVGKTLLVRLKKMDRRGYARAIPTQATLMLTNVVEPSLFCESELPPIFNIDMGYVLNELETRIDHILVAARYGDSVIWSYEADRGVGIVAGTIVPRPAAPLSPSRVIKVPVEKKYRKDDGQV
jgi:hypothetical protein